MPDRTVNLDYGNEKRETTVQEHELGDLGLLRDGRTYRYNFVNGAITAGKVMSHGAIPTAHNMDLVTAITAIGATSINVTLGAAAIAADAFKDGYIWVNDLIGEGQMFKIATHAAFDSGAAVAVPILDEGGVRTALDATSLCGMMPNIWTENVICPTTGVGAVTGATTRDRADNTYGWVQRGGYAALWVQGTVVISSVVTTSAITAGSVDADSNEGTTQREVVGTIANGVIPATTDYGPINMNMNP